MSKGRRKFRGVVIAEDQRTQSFFHHLLKSLGYGKFYRVPVPDGKGAGDAWVRAQYVRWVRDLRSKNYQRNYCVIAICDGDALGVDRRKVQFDQALKEAKLEKRSQNERIATPVPTWAIENWLLDLLGHPDINEARKPASEGPTWKEVFEHQYGDDERAALIGAATRWRDAPARLQSLEDGRLELERIDQ